MLTSQATATGWKKIDLMSGPDYPLPLSSDEDGSLWRFGNFVVSWQTNAKSVHERAAELLGRSFTRSAAYPYVVMGFAVENGMEASPAIILSVVVPLDQAAVGEEQMAIVKLAAAEREVVLGELPRWSTLSAQELQQLLFNTFGDFIGLHEGEVIRHLGAISRFHDPEIWEAAH